VSNQPKHTVYHTAVIDAAPADVWKVVRDVLALVEICFGDGVKDAHWVGGTSAEHVPAKFQFTMLPGNELITEEVVGRNELERSLTYRTVGQALSIHDYVGTYRVLPVTNQRDKSFMEWSREFRLADDADPDFLPMFLQMIKTETDTVQAYFAR
jgi:hypothetical protein